MQDRQSLTNYALHITVPDRLTCFFPTFLYILNINNFKNVNNFRNEISFMVSVLHINGILFVSENWRWNSHHQLLQNVPLITLIMKIDFPPILSFWLLDQFQTCQRTHRLPIQIKCGVSHLRKQRYLISTLHHPEFRL